MRSPRYLPTLALALALLVPSCDKDDNNSPTEPPPMGGPTITASSGARVPLTGTWRSRCFTTPAGSPVASIQETFVVSLTDIAVALSGFLTDDCSGLSITEELEVDYSLAAESTATLNGASVPVTRVDGTVRENGEPFLQIFHIDDSGTHRLFHGDLEDPPTDAAGYPTELFVEGLDRQ